jgi:hypothetical protein
MHLRAIALMMETERFSETSVYFHETTGRYIPEGCHLQESTGFISLRLGVGMRIILK